MDKSKKQIAFEEERKDLSDRDLKVELLYSNWLNYTANEKNRKNTSNIVWIIVIGIVLTVINAMMSFGRL